MPWNCGVLLWGASSAGEDLWGANVRKGPIFRTPLIKQVKEKIIWPCLQVVGHGNGCFATSLPWALWYSPTHCGPFPLHH